MVLVPGEGATTTITIPTTKATQLVQQTGIAGRTVFGVAATTQANYATPLNQAINAVPPLPTTWVAAMQDSLEVMFHPMEV